MIDRAVWGERARGGGIRKMWRKLANCGLMERERDIGAREEGDEKEFTTFVD